MSQEELINSVAKRIRCVAGPGTGKTWAIKERVKRILSSDPQNTSKIFAVTYTRLAAEQLKRDLCDSAIDESNRITASTLHSYAFKILQQEQAIEALGRFPRPCLPSELDVLKHDLARDFGGVRNVDKKLKALFTMWARLQNEEPGRPQNSEDQRFHNIYLKWMEFHKCISIDELIALVVSYLRNNPDSEFSNKFNYIVVDEYQDLNKADQTFIDLLGINSDVLIVGDDDQSIYSFRHANPEGIREWFENQIGSKKDIQLNECRRCDGKIITLANSLISKNTNRLRDNLLPMSGREESGDVSIIQWKTRNKETDGLAQGIKKLMDNNKVPEGETILVLVPRKEFGTKLKEKLSNLDIACCLKTGPEWNNKLIGEKICLAYLYENRDDLVALRYWLGLNDRNWYTNKYRVLYNYCVRNSISPISVLSNISKCQELNIAVLHDRYNELNSIMETLGRKTTDEIIDYLFPINGETEKLGKIIRDIKENSSEEFSFQKAIIEAVISLSEESTDDRVKIMTLFGAKGLTSHTVIVAGLVNGILPTVSNPPSSEISKLEEERRLMFVAITRAKKRIVLSSFKKVTRGENKNLRLGLVGSNYYLYAQPSRFLSDLGPTRPNLIDGNAWLDSIA